MNRKHPKRLWLLLLVPAFAAGAWAVRHFPPGQAQNPPAQSRAAQPAAPQVEVAPARRGTITRTLELGGEIVAVESVVITTTSEGLIVYCPWREGDRVRTGDKLVEIDRETRRAETGIAEAVLAAARARLADLEAGARPEEIRRAEATVRSREAAREEAQRALERLEMLLAEDFTSRESVDQARERLAVAAAELTVARETLRLLETSPTPTQRAIQTAAVEEAAARLALARAYLAEAVISAPFDGVIARVHVRPGDLAAPRAPLLDFYNPDSLVVRFAVPEAEAAAVHSGMRLRATLDALPGKVFRGRVTRVYPGLDETMRTRTVEATLDAARALFPQMFARVTLELEKAENTVLVPADAVLTTPAGERFVFVVGADRKVRRQVIETGLEEEQAIEATRGVEPGEMVVVAGQAALRHGREVRIAGEPGPGGTRGAGKPSPGPGGSNGQ